MKIEEGNLEDFSPKFAVKLRAVYKVLNFNALQNGGKIGDFVKIFYQFLSMLISSRGDILYGCPKNNWEKLS